MQSGVTTEALILPGSSPRTGVSSKADMTRRSIQARLYPQMLLQPGYLRVSARIGPTAQDSRIV